MNQYICMRVPAGRSCSEGPGRARARPKFDLRTSCAELYIYFKSTREYASAIINTVLHFWSTNEIMSSRFILSMGRVDTYLLGTS